MMQSIEFFQVLKTVTAFIQLEYYYDRDWKLYLLSIGVLNTKLQFENPEVSLAKKFWFFQYQTIAECTFYVLLMHTCKSFINAYMHTTNTCI